MVKDKVKIIFKKINYKKYLKKIFFLKLKKKFLKDVLGDPMGLIK